MKCAKCEYLLKDWSMLSALLDSCCEARLDLHATETTLDTGIRMQHQNNPDNSKLHLFESQNR